MNMLSASICEGDDNNDELNNEYDDEENDFGFGYFVCNF